MIWRVTWTWVGLECERSDSRIKLPLINEGDANFSRPTVRGWTLSTFDFIHSIPLLLYVVWPTWLAIYVVRCQVGRVRVGRQTDRQATPRMCKRYRFYEWKDEWESAPFAQYVLSIHDILYSNFVCHRHSHSGVRPIKMSEDMVDGLAFTFAEFI